LKEYYYFLNRKAKYKKVIGIFRFDKSKPNYTQGEYIQFNDPASWRDCMGTLSGIRKGILKGRPYSKTSDKRVEEILFLREI